MSTLLRLNSATVSDNLRSEHEALMRNLGTDVEVTIEEMENFVRKCVDNAHEVCIVEDREWVRSWLLFWFVELRARHGHDPSYCLDIDIDREDRRPAQLLMRADIED
jgi:hypothetical protein